MAPVREDPKRPAAFDNLRSRGQFVQPQGPAFFNNPNITLFSPTARSSLEEPLPGIPPMEFRLGLRFHEPTTGQTQSPRWGVETTARIVMAQGREQQNQRADLPTILPAQADERQQSARRIR